MTVFETVVPLFTSGLQTYDHILAKAEAYAQDKSLDVDATFVEARLIDDMLPLVFQVTNTTNLVGINVSRLTGEAPPSFDPPSGDKETTIAALRTRVQTALAWVQGVDAAKAVGKEESTVQLPALGQQHTTTAKTAVLTHGLPNFFFHLNAGYAILRSKGVPVGKKDYLSPFLPF